MPKNDKELLEYVLAALRTAKENACDLPTSYRCYYLEGAISQIENLIEAHCNEPLTDDSKDEGLGYFDDFEDEDIV